jgi:hypothetical protein
MSYQDLFVYCLNLQDELQFLLLNFIVVLPDCVHYYLLILMEAYSLNRTPPTCEALPAPSNRLLHKRL